MFQQCSLGTVCVGAEDEGLGSRLVVTPQVFKHEDTCHAIATIAACGKREIRRNLFEEDQRRPLIDETQPIGKRVIRKDNGTFGNNGRRKMTCGWSDSATYHQTLPSRQGITQRQEDILIETAREDYLARGYKRGYTP
jgi:hypothetical protein